MQKTLKCFLDHKRTLTAIACVFVSTCLVIWLLSGIDVRQTWKLLLSCNKQYLFLAFLYMAVTPLCCVVRWIGILKSQGNIKIRFYRAFYAIMLSNILNCFLPSKSGDIVKSIFIRKQCGLSSGVGTVILERLIDLFILGLLGVIGYMASEVFWGLYIGVVLVLVVTVIFIMTVLCPMDIVPRKIRLFVCDIKNVFINWLNNPYAMAQSIAGSLCNWILAGLTISFLGLAINDQVNWGHLLSIFPTAILVGLLPFTVSGIGVRDAAFVFLLRDQMTREQATLIGLGYTVLGYWFIALFSLCIGCLKLLQYRSKHKTTSNCSRRISC